VRAVLLAVIFAYAATAARAEEAETLFLKGAGQLARSQWAAAEESLSQALERLPGHPDILALLGMARYHRGRYRRAADDLSAALRGDTRYRARALYCLGLALSMSGEEARARRTFARLLDEHPSSPEADRVRGAAAFWRRDEPQPETRPGSVLLSAGYDTHATRSVDVPTASGFQGDGFLSVFASSRTPIGEEGAQLGASLLWRDYSALDEFDYFTFSGRVELGRRAGERLSLRPFAGGRWSWLGGDRFEDGYSAGLRLVREPERGWTVDVDASAALMLHGRLYSGLDGTEVGGNARLLHGGESFRTGLVARGRRVSADLAYLGYLEGEGGLAVSLVAASGKLMLDLEGGAGSRLYDDVNPTYATRREDAHAYVRATVVLSVWKHVFLQAHGTCVRHESNVSNYVYDQFVGSVGVVSSF
jgi:tetratricopeptide (TPR) repeat protein